MKCCIKTASGFGGCNAALVLSLPDAHLKQKANSQATDKASAPSVYKAVVESGNMVTIRSGAVESKGTTVFSSSETDFAPFIREAYKHLGENNMKFYKMDNLCKLGYVAAEYLLKDTNYHRKRLESFLPMLLPLWIRTANIRQSSVKKETKQPVLPCLSTLSPM